MASNGISSRMENLDLSDQDTEDLFASPSRTKFKTHKAKRSVSEAPQTPASSNQANVTPGPSRFDAEETREVALRKELEGIRNINDVIEGVVDSMEKAKGNMDSVSRTVSNASALLQTWTRILSQTEHNQRLILNPSWHGATQDMADAENETLLRHQLKERKEIEVSHRRDAAARKAEEDERRRSEAAIVRGTGRGTRGRGRGTAAGRAGSTGYVGVGGQGGVRGTTRGGATPGRTASGIGRGTSSGRGTNRGTVPDAF